MDLPAWVTELTDPRRATTCDELADRLVPLAEHAIDVSRRLQALLNELNEPFKREALHELVDRLKERTGEALEEVSAEIASSGAERLDRIRAAWRDRLGEDGERRLLDADADIVPSLARQEQEVVRQITDETAEALREAIRTLLARVDELAVAVTDMIHEVLPAAHEGLGLASRISGLAGRIRAVGRQPIPDDLGAEADDAVRSFDEAVAGLELEWAALGARSATVRGALRGAEEAAFSEVTGRIGECVAGLAAAHIKILGEIEARALDLVDGPPGS